MRATRLKIKKDINLQSMSVIFLFFIFTYLSVNNKTCFCLSSWHIQMNDS